jgi:uncharacterized protein GlcG (DUF336 family)
MSTIGGGYPIVGGATIGRLGLSGGTFAQDIASEALSIPT